MYKLVLLRHGESTWNLENRFTGWTDVPLTATDAAAALDPANFNADAVVALIDGSTLDDATKATLKTAVEAAKANPALVADTVGQAGEGVVAVAMITPSPWSAYRGCLRA